MGGEGHHPIVVYMVLPCLNALPIGTNNVETLPLLESSITRIFLSNKRASHLYKPGMTIEQAEEAVNQWKFQKRQQHKEQKRNDKQARVARASDPAHQTSKSEMIERTKSVAQAEEAAQKLEEERINNMTKKHKKYMQRRAMDEVNTDGESD